MQKAGTYLFSERSVLIVMNRKGANWQSFCSVSCKRSVSS